MGHRTTNIRVCLLACVLLQTVAPGICFSQQKTENKQAHSELKLNNLIQLAKGAAPEVAADALLTIASSKLSAKKSKKLELIEEAFRLTERVREPVKRKSVGMVIDSRAGYKGMAYSLGLDKLSLQTRAIAAMVPLDPFRARVMFDTISLPRVSTLSCEDSLIYDFDSYYQTLQLIAERSFNAEEKKSLAQIHYVSARLQEIQNIPQLTAASSLLLNAAGSAEETLTFLPIFVTSMDRLSAEPRSFAFVMDRDSFLLSIHKLIFKLKERQVPAANLVNALRGFLTKNLSSSTCQDVAWIRKGQLTLPPLIDRLNSEFANPITIDEIKPLSVGPRANDVEYWTTKSGTAVLKAAKELRFGGTSVPLNLEQRQTEEWSEKLQQYLKLLETWDAGAEASADDYFQQKCNAYRVVVELCPNDAQREIVLRRYGAYLLEANKKYKGSIEWILPVKEYLRALRFKDEQTLRSSLEPWLSANDTNLRVYGEMALMMN